MTHHFRSIRESRGYHRRHRGPTEPHHISFALFLVGLAIGTIVFLVFCQITFPEVLERLAQ